MSSFYNICIEKVEISATVFSCCSVKSTANEEKTTERCHGNRPNLILNCY